MERHTHKDIERAIQRKKERDEMIERGKRQ